MAPKQTKRATGTVGEGRFLDSTLIDVMWTKQAPWTQLEREKLEWHTHTHPDIHTLTIVSLTLTCHCHWHPPVYRLVYLHYFIPCPNLPTMIRLWVDNVLLINTRRLSIVIDKPVPLSIGFPTLYRELVYFHQNKKRGDPRVKNVSETVTPRMMILLHPNKKRRESGKKCHTRTMMHSQSIEFSTWRTCSVVPELRPKIV
jgi:hypothetical protein